MDVLTKSRTSEDGDGKSVDDGVREPVEGLEERVESLRAGSGGASGGGVGRRGRGAVVVHGEVVAAGEGRDEAGRAGDERAAAGDGWDG